MKLVGVSFKPDLCAAIDEGRKDVTRRSSFKGAVGDVLYVREAIHDGNHGWTTYQRDGALVLIDGLAVQYPTRWKRDKQAAMYMPRWAARTFRRIVDVHTERLHDITEDDARREGVEPLDWIDHRGIPLPKFRLGFRDRWDAINSTRPGLRWQDNPEIVRVEFAPLPPDMEAEVKQQLEVTNG